MKNILQIHIIEIDGEKAVDIMRNGYNIIQETIYNDDIAAQILQLIKDNSETGAGLEG